MARDPKTEWACSDCGVIVSVLHRIEELPRKDQKRPLTIEQLRASFEVAAQIELVALRVCGRCLIRRRVAERKAAMR